MAWIDDRVWCLPKFTQLSSPAFRVYINGVAYSSGMGTRGHLNRQQQKLVGGVGRPRAELIEARFWHEISHDSVFINDWDVYNKKRDDRRAADRIRKRIERQTSAGQSAGQVSGQVSGRLIEDGSDGSDTSKRTRTSKNKCPECDVTLPGPLKLAEHLYQIHDGPEPAHWIEAEARTSG